MRQFKSTLHEAGWYPNTVTQLNEFIWGALNDSEQQAAAIALILPHAGYVYSGKLAARGMKSIEASQPKRIVIIGPSHATHLPNQASILDVDAYETVLGHIQIDTEMRDRLLATNYVQSLPGAHRTEHSVQIMLPFIQMLDPVPSIVPIVLGQIDSETSIEMASVIRPMLDDDTALIISSDFTHYGPQFRYVPFVDDVSSNVRNLDFGAIDFILEKNAEGFRHYVSETGATICGRDPIELLLRLLPDDANGRVLDYDTSGRMTGDWSHTVSYASVAFEGSWSES